MIVAQLTLGFDEKIEMFFFCFCSEEKGLRDVQEYALRRFFRDRIYSSQRNVQDTFNQHMKKVQNIKLSFDGKHFSKRNSHSEEEYIASKVYTYDVFSRKKN